MDHEEKEELARFLYSVTRQLLAMQDQIDEIIKKMEQHGNDS